MGRLITYALAITVSMGTAALLAKSGFAGRQSQTADAQLAADGAFRDGLYLGKLSAERGRPMHPMTGRWSTEKDRASFVAGYRRGYNDFLASATANAQPARPE